MDIKLNRTESQPDIDFEKRNFILVSSDPLSDLMPDFTGKNYRFDLNFDFQRS